MSANDNAGPSGGSNGMSHSPSVPSSTTKAHSRCCMEIRLGCQNGQGHHTATQHHWKSKLWIRRTCSRLPETWHAYGRHLEYMVARWKHLPVHRWWRNLDHTLGLEPTRGLHQEVLYLQQCNSPLAKPGLHGHDSQPKADWVGILWALHYSDSERLYDRWMMEALVIDPFDSNRWMYGTGGTIQGGHDLLKWDSTRNITLQSVADGIEETSILGLISPPTGPRLISGVGDIGGTYDPLHVAPAASQTPPQGSFITTWPPLCPRHSQIQHGLRPSTSILLAPSPMLSLGSAPILGGQPSSKIP